MILLITKILFTLFLLILIPIYWKNYGPKNFLWLSDIGLFLTFFALWLESPLLISIAMVGIFPFELMWNIDFFYHLLTGNSLTSISDYMFDSKYPLFLRLLSLFHIFLPLIWIYLLFQWGYDKQAFMYSIVMLWIVLILNYLITDPKENINWVFMPQVRNWAWISNWLWLIILMIGFPTLVFLPMHLILQYLV